MGLNEQIYTGASEVLSRVAPCQRSLMCAVSALPFLSCRMHTGCTLGPTLHIWLMVRFCSTDISEIMSLDLRRSSICTDCHRPTDTVTVMSWPGEPSPHTHKGSSSDKLQDALIPGLQSLEKVVTWECKKWVCSQLRKAVQTHMPVLPDAAILLQSWTAPQKPFI
uniref:Uncharacterized protein n=1 Tax=Pavo cristatus TaxID=9049 RepID=A0A8C9EZ95_PAVCR